MRQTVADQRKEIESLKALDDDSLKDRERLDRAMQIRLFCEVLRVSWSEFKEPEPDPDPIKAEHKPIELKPIDVKLIAPIAMDEGLRFAIREGGRTVGSGVVSKITK